MSVEAIGWIAGNCTKKKIKCAQVAVRVTMTSLLKYLQRSFSADETQEVPDRLRTYSDTMEPLIMNSKVMTTNCIVRVQT